MEAVFRIGDKSEHTIFVILLSLAPQLSQLPITSYGARLFAKITSFFLSTLLAIYETVIFARTFQKRFCGCP
jgi:hypothetical protein